MLLQLLMDASMDDISRLAGSIYFKNYIWQRWDIESEIPAQDRNTIKENLLKCMLSVPKQVQAQLSAALEQIACSDFPEEWKNLLPELVETIKGCMVSKDLTKFAGAMETVYAVCKRFKNEGLSYDLKYLVETFQQTHKDSFQFICQHMFQPNVSEQDLKLWNSILLSSCRIFYVFNKVDLPGFFEDNMTLYFQGFLTFLKYNNPALTGPDDDTPGPLEELKGQVVDNLSLYAEKYQEELEALKDHGIGACVKSVWELLMASGLTEKNDYLVASGIHFLSVASTQKWNPNPFDDDSVLTAICEKVVLPNIRLRPSDIELFEMNPQEYIRRDIEGADQDTRRRSSIDLVKSLGRFYDKKVTGILMNYVQQAMQKPGANELDKDMCIYLIIAMAVRGQTRMQGVTALNQDVPYMQFLEQFAFPPLAQANINPVLHASCLRYVTIFRNQLTKNQVIQLIPAVVKHVGSNSAVVHTYAANCIERILSVKDRDPATNKLRNRFQAAELKDSLRAAIPPLIARLTNLNDTNALLLNEYLMRCLMRIFSFLGKEAVDLAVDSLQKLAALCDAVAKNPSNPLFNHYLFETIASIVRVAVPAHVQQVEASLLPVCAKILETNVVDFIPYAFQILGLLLDHTTNVHQIYLQLFATCLKPDLWKSPANVPGLVRLFKAYFIKHAAFRDTLNQNLQQIVDCFRFVLGHKKIFSSAFDMLNNMFRYVPFDIYQSKLQEIIQTCLTRLQRKPSPKLKKDFVISMSLLEHKQQTHVVPKVFESIQAGLAGNILEHVWFPSLDMMVTPAQKKICALGLAKLMTDPVVCTNQKLLSVALDKMSVLLGLKENAFNNRENINSLNVIDESDDDGNVFIHFQIFN